jgi:dihydrofolate reductase
MGKVVTGATMSLDGYIAGPGESGFDLLFQWYGTGEVEIRTINPELTFHVSAASAEFFEANRKAAGALVVGRHLYDVTSAWGGRHPLDLTTVVLTHEPPADRPVADDNFVFVTGGIAEAVATARTIAGDRNVVVNGGQMARQALDAGLLDEIGVDLVPVLLGAGTPFFPSLGVKPVQLDGPATVVPGIGVTHLVYRVAR